MSRAGILRDAAQHLSLHELPCFLRIAGEWISYHETTQLLDVELQGPGLSNLLAVYGENGRTRMQWKREYKNVVVHGLGFARPNKSLSLSPFCRYMVSYQETTKLLDVKVQRPGLSNLLAVYGKYGRTRAFLSMNCHVFSVLPVNGFHITKPHKCWMLNFKGLVCLIYWRYMANMVEQEPFSP
jgi:hypothetical protein